MPRGSATIGITTFNRPTYCTALLEQLASDEIDGYVDEVLVIDQGTSAVRDDAAYPAAAARLGSMLRLVEQPNLGGSGGFSRAMLETLDVDRRPTSCCSTTTSSASRRGSRGRLPSQTTPGGRPSSVATCSACTSARSCTPSQRSSSRGSSVGPQPIPHDTTTTSPTSNLRSTPWLHRRMDVDYNGWWMCLIPVDVLRDIGLSLPLFIKWDDAEYGLRAAAAGYPTVSLPGAAVWHVPWTDKDDSVDWQAYFHARNRFVAALLHSPFAFGGRMVRESLAIQVKHLLGMQYSAAALRQQALRDVLAGPERLHQEPAAQAGGGPGCAGCPPGRPSAARPRGVRRCSPGTPPQARPGHGAPCRLAGHRHRCRGRPGAPGAAGAGLVRRAPRAPHPRRRRGVVVPVQAGLRAGVDHGRDRGLVAPARPRVGAAGPAREHRAAPTAAPRVAVARPSLPRRPGRPRGSGRLAQDARGDAPAGVPPGRSPAVEQRPDVPVTSAVEAAPLVVQGRGGGLREALHRRHLLSLLVRKELRVRYRASVLGLGWSYVKPAVQFAVYFVGMGLLLDQRAIGDYAVYLFGGLAVVTTFSEAVGNATRSVVVNGDLVRKIYLPRELFPLSSLCVAAVHLAPQLVVLSLGALAAGWRPDAVGLVALVAGLVLTFALALGCGLLLAALNVLFRDVENVVDLLLMVLVWVSPVLYPWQRVAEPAG